MSETAGQTPYEFAKAFFCFLAARAVTVGDYLNPSRSGLRVHPISWVNTGGRRWLSCGLPADWRGGEKP